MSRAWDFSPLRTAGAKLAEGTTEVTAAAVAVGVAGVSLNFASTTSITADAVAVGAAKVTKHVVLAAQRASALGAPTATSQAAGSGSFTAAAVAVGVANVSLLIEQGTSTTGVEFDDWLQEVHRLLDDIISQIDEIADLSVAADSIELSLSRLPSIRNELYAANKPVLHRSDRIEMARTLSRLETSVQESSEILSDFTEDLDVHRNTIEDDVGEVKELLANIPDETVIGEGARIFRTLYYFDATAVGVAGVTLHVIATPPTAHVETVPVVARGVANAIASYIPGTGPITYNVAAACTAVAVPEVTATYVRGNPIVHNLSFAATAVGVPVASISPTIAPSSDFVLPTFWGPAAIRFTSLGDVGVKGDINDASGAKAVRFKAWHTGSISTVHWFMVHVHCNFNGDSSCGCGYAAGHGGTIKISIYATNSSGMPTGSPLGGSATVVRPHGNVASLGEPPGNNYPQFVTHVLGRRYDDGNFGGGNLFGFTPAPVTAGNIYCVVWENTDSSPSSNFIAVDVFNHSSGALNTTAPIPHSEYAVLQKSSGSWGQRVDRVAGCVELHYTDGFRQPVGPGGGYMEVVPSAVSDITSTLWVRQRFQVNRTITISRIAPCYTIKGGTGALLWRIKQGSTTLRNGSIAASLAPTGGSRSNCNWVRSNLSSELTLTPGITYFAEFQAATSGTTYWMGGARSGGTAAGNSGRCGCPTGPIGYTDGQEITILNGLAELSTNSGESWSGWAGRDDMDIMGLFFDRNGAAL